MKPSQRYMIDSDTLAIQRLEDDGGPPATYTYKLATYVRDGSDPDGPYYNGLRFETAEECEDYGKDLYSRWMMLKRYEVHPSTDPVTHRIVDGIAFSLRSLEDHSNG